MKAHLSNKVRSFHLEFKKSYNTFVFENFENLKSYIIQIIISLVNLDIFRVLKKERGSSAIDLANEKRMEKKYSFWRQIWALRRGFKIGKIFFSLYTA